MVSKTTLTLTYSEFPDTVPIFIMGDRDWSVLKKKTTHD